MKIKPIAWLLFFVVVLAGCNTMSGLGKDVKKVGEKLHEAAEDCKDEGGCRD